MSITYENYKLVGRTYFRRLLDQTNENCACYNCSYCIRGNKIRLELYKNGYQTFNKDVQCWKVTENYEKVEVSPCREYSMDTDKKIFMRKKIFYNSCIICFI